MNCNLLKNLRILIIPLEHSQKEDILYDILPHITKNCDNLIIYWESINRDDRTGGTEGSFKKMGLEDNKLLALFEFLLFIIVSRDNRLHEDIYKGTGVKSKKHADVQIYQKASNLAKGSQAVVNLRDHLNSSKGFKTSKSFGVDLYKEVNDYDADELIKERNNFDALNIFEEKLYHIYNLLIKSLQNNSEYNYIDYKLINKYLGEVSDDNNFFDSRAAATYLKEYAKYIRDVSNTNYILNNFSKLNISNAICCIGSAHSEDLRELLVSHDKSVEVNIVNIMDKIENRQSENEIQKMISKELNKFFI